MSPHDCCNGLLNFITVKKGKWEQLCTDATSVGNVCMQDVILSISEDDALKPIVLTAATILENGESAEATCDSVTSAIVDNSRHLTGLKEVLKYYYPNKIYYIPDESEMSMAKLVNAHLTSDTCDPARATIRKLKDEVINASRRAHRSEQEIRNEWADLAPLIFGKGSIVPPFTFLTELPAFINVFTTRCWNHLRNVWFGNVTKSLTA